MSLTIISDNSAAPLTDHCLIKLKFQKSDNNIRNKGYWKFNSSLLYDEAFCKDIVDELNIIYENENITSYVNKWEFSKFKTRQIAIKYSKLATIKNKQLEDDTIKEINEICSKTVLSECHKQRLGYLQTCLDNIYTTKAKGAYLRSRAKWIENGEKSTSYFCRLETIRQEKYCIKSLNINGNLCTDPKEISLEISKFYSKLYSSSFSKIDADSFFNSISHLIPKIDEHFKDVCENDITLDELDKALKSLSLDKAPGCDGITSNFYKHFWILYWLKL